MRLKTEVAVIAFIKGCATLVEIASGTAVDDVLRHAEARLKVATALRIMTL